MSEVTNVPGQVLDQLSNFPPEVGHPAVAGVAAIATGLAVAAEFRLHELAKDKFATRFHNEVVLKQAIEDIGGNSRAHRIVAAIGATVGVGLAAGSWGSELTYDSERADSNSRVAIVVDSSLSMRHTQDMGDGKTRYASVIDGIANSGYGGHLAVVETGQNYRVSLPMDPEWRSKVDKLEQPHKEVDPNGGELVPAVDEAISLLPHTRTNSKNSNVTRKGTVVMISDGTITSNQSDLAAVASKAKKSGVKLRIVVPGTEAGTYSVNGSPANKSGIKPEVFSELGRGNMAQASTASEVEDAIKEAVKTPSQAKETKDWTLPIYVGFGMIALSAFYGGYKELRKFV